LEVALSYTVVLHIQNESPVVGEIEEMPAMTDQLIAVNNPRTKDGKDLQYLDEGVLKVYWPVSRINFIEIVSGRDEEEIISFVRE